MAAPLTELYPADAMLPLAAPLVRVTRKGCECQREWQYNGQAITTFCGNPDASEAEWCFVTREACEGKNWGYCAVPSPSPSPLRPPLSPAPSQPP